MLYFNHPRLLLEPKLILSVWTEKQEKNSRVNRSQLSIVLLFVPVMYPCYWSCPVIFSCCRLAASPPDDINPPKPRRELILPGSARSVSTTKTNSTKCVPTSSLFVQVLGNSGVSCVMQ